MQTHPSSLPTWRQNVGYGSVLVGLLAFVLGLLWLANAFLMPGAPSTFSLRTCIITIVVGGLVFLFGLALVWPKEKRRP